MAPPSAPKFGVKFPTRKERTVKRVTKCETREIQKRLEPPKPPKPPRVRAPAKSRASKQPPPATLVKPKAPRVSASRSNVRPPSVGRSVPTSNVSRSSNIPGSARTLQLTDLEKLARLNCSREFSIFHKHIKPELAASIERQLGFLQTKLQHLKNEFVNKNAEHHNIEQIREYYLQAVRDHERRNIKPDEFLTLVEKLKQDTKQAIDKWLKKKEFKPTKQLTEYLQKRQARIRDRIKETLEEAKKQQEQTKEGEGNTESSIVIESASTIESSIVIESVSAMESSIIIESANTIEPPIIIESVISVEISSANAATADDPMIIE